MIWLWTILILFLWLTAFGLVIFVLVSLNNFYYFVVLSISVSITWICHIIVFSFFLFQIMMIILAFNWKGQSICMHWCYGLLDVFLPSHSICPIFFLSPSPPHHAKNWCFWFVVLYLFYFSHSIFSFSNSLEVTCYIAI